MFFVFDGDSSPGNLLPAVTEIITFLLIYYWLSSVFPGGSAGKESACNAGELGSIPGLGRSLEKGKVTHSSMLAWRIPWTV